MGIGPIPAVRQLLDRPVSASGDVDLVELNEAFASQSVAVCRELGLDEERVNVNGGAIAPRQSFRRTRSNQPVKVHDAVFAYDVART